MSDETAELDEVVHQRIRLGIMSMAYEAKAVEFGQLQTVLGLTPGNLNGHLRALESAGLIRVQKGFRGRRPLTSIDLTAAGRQAFRDEISRLRAIIARADAVDAQVQSHSDARTAVRRLRPT